MCYGVHPNLDTCFSRKVQTRCEQEHSPSTPQARAIQYILHSEVAGERVSAPWLAHWCAKCIAQSWVAQHDGPPCALTDVLPQPGCQDLVQVALDHAWVGGVLLDQVQVLTQQGWGFQPGVSSLWVVVE